MSETRSKGEELLIYILIGLALVALWTASRQWAFMIPLALIFCAHPFLGHRFQPNLGVIPHGLIIVVGLGGVRFIEPLTGVGGNRFHGTFFFALVAMLLAAAKLYAPPSRTRLPRILLYTALATSLSAVALPDFVESSPAWRGTSLLGPLTPSPGALFIGLTLAFAATALVALRSRMRVRRGDPRRAFVGRWVAFGACVLIAVAASAGASWASKTYYEDLSRVYATLLGAGSPGQGRGGFSGSGDLSSVSLAREDGADEVALRVYSPDRPGYLRGALFSDYTRKGWTVQWGEAAPVTPGDAPLVLPGREAPTSGPLLTVHAESGGDAFFLPLWAAAVQTSAPGVHVHEPGPTLRCADGETPAGYGVYFTDAPLHAEREVQAYLDLPETGELLAALDATLQELGLTPGAPVDEAVDAIAGHFRMTFTYEVGVKVKKNKDPLPRFLREDRRGHCELFATAGALLLRRLMVPARYATGYVCEESNPLDREMWIARNRYAHAWVELYDPAKGWVEVDFTPPGGRPQTMQTSGLAAFFQWLGGLWTQMKAALVALPAKLGEWLSRARGWLSGGWWRWALVLGVIAALISLVRRVRLPRREPIRERTFGGEVAALRERYLELEARLRRAGLGRLDHETLLEYRARLEGEPLPPQVDRGEALGLVHDFAAIRYGATA